MKEFLGLNNIIDIPLFLRGIIITLYAMFLFRANSSRLFGDHSAFDFIISIILGAILGEAIVNNIPLIPSMIVCALIVLLHKLLAYISYKSHRFGKYIKGEKVLIYKNNKYVKNNLQCCRITENDVLQSLRMQWGIGNIKDVKEATLERNGQISFIMKNPIN